jgi:hypothetical protein
VKLIEAAKLSIPQMKLCTCGIMLPDYLLDMIVARRLARKSKRHSPVLIEEYISLTKLLDGEIGAFKNQSWRRFLVRQGTNPLNSKPIWQRINKIRQNKSGDSIPKLIHEGKEHKSDGEKANVFASVPSKVFADLDDKRFNKEHKIAADEFIANYNFNPHSYSEKALIKLGEHNNILNILKANSAPSDDGIHNKMLINSSLSFRKILLA